MSPIRFSAGSLNLVAILLVNLEADLKLWILKLSFNLQTSAFNMFSFRLPVSAIRFNSTYLSRLTWGLLLILFVCSVCLIDCLLEFFVKPFILFAPKYVSMQPPQLCLSADSIDSHQCCRFSVSICSSNSATYFDISLLFCRYAAFSHSRF